jgi:hypothetical protein
VRLSPELKQAIALVQSKQFTRENYQTLLRLADETEDDRIGDMVEAFIAAAPNVDFLNQLLK